MDVCPSLPHVTLMLWISPVSGVGASKDGVPDSGSDSGTPLGAAQAPAAGVPGCLGTQQTGGVRPAEPEGEEGGALEGEEHAKEQGTRDQDAVDGPHRC